VLTILVMYGSKTSMNSRTRNVGIESSDDDFTGDDITIFRTWDSVHGRNDDSEDDAGTDTDGGCRPAVSFRTASTLAAKNSAKLVAVWSVAPSTFRSRPSSDDSERHSSDGVRPQRISRISLHYIYHTRYSIGV